MPPRKKALTPEEVAKNSRLKNAKANLITVEHIMQEPARIVGEVIALEDDIEIAWTYWRYPQPNFHVFVEKEQIDCWSLTEVAQVIRKVRKKVPLTYSPSEVLK